MSFPIENSIKSSINKKYINERKSNYENYVQFDKLREQESTINKNKTDKDDEIFSKLEQNLPKNKNDKYETIILNDKKTILRNDKSNNENYLQKKTQLILTEYKNNNGKKNLDKYENNKENENNIKENINNVIDEKFVPLSNPIGENACYVNVSIQLLYNSISFREYIFSLKPDLNNFDELINSFYNIFIEYKSMSMKIQPYPIDTTIFRKILKAFSQDFFQFGCSADPIEFIIFLFNCIGIYNRDNIQKMFYIDIIEEFNCNECKNKQTIKYDKDNFFHQIYIEEILNYCIINGNIFEYFCNKLFIINKEISYQVMKSCEKCQKNKLNRIMEKRTICKQLPYNFLVNCIWSNKNPNLEQIIKIYFMIQNEFEIKNLYDTDNIKKSYIFKGMILYSYYQYHYIVCIYDFKNKQYILCNDENIINFQSMEKMIDYLIIPEQKIYFYPVMLIYIENENKYKINFNLKKTFYNSLIKKVEDYKSKEENIKKLKNLKENEKEISKNENEDENSSNDSNKLAKKFYKNYFSQKYENKEEPFEKNNKNYFSKTQIIPVSKVYEKNDKKTNNIGNNSLNNNYFLNSFTNPLYKSNNIIKRSNNKNK